MMQENNHPIDRLNGKAKKLLRRVLRKGGKMDRISAFLIPKPQDDLGAPEQQASSTILFGAWMVALVFGVLGLWSMIAPLDSAAIAPGKVVVNSNRKTISHYEGGIVDAILVRNGDIVEKDAPLLRLREVQAKAQVDLLDTQLLNNLIIESRLIAERDGAKEMALPVTITQRQYEPAVAEIIRNQQSIFTSRTENVHGQLDVLKTQISKHEQEIRGLEMQERAMSDQIAFLNEEIGVVEELLKSGNAARPRLLALKREASELIGRRGEYMSMKAKAHESISETKLTMLNTQSEYMNRVLQELKETQQALSETRERMTASSDVLDRIIIRAPERGIVNDLQAHTVDGVIRPGDKILDIIPLDDKLIVEAKVSPLDIDVVRTDLPARVRLTAFKTRQLPALDGKVIFVSADQFNDERTGESYFLSRVEIAASELEGLSNIELYPGMPAEALIVTGSRSFMAYLMEPITDSFNHSFRQQ